MANGIGERLATSSAPLILLLAVMAGCTNPSLPATGQPATQGEASGPPKVNRLVLGIAPPNGESHLMSVASTLSYWPMNPMYEFLLGVGTDGKEPTPQLATEWTLDPDGSSYRFKLRQGVQFHNNFGEMTSKDVRYTWETMRDEVDPLRTPQAITVLTQIKDVETPGNYEAVMRLQKPDSGFLAAIGQAENVFPIFSKADGATRTRPPSLQDKPYAGTAPYQYLERQQSQYLRYQKIPFQHWRQMPDFPEFEWRFIREDSTRLSAILAREIHVAALPPDLVTQATTAGLKAIPGKAPGLHSFLSLYGVWMNVRLRDTEKLHADPNAVFVFPDSPMMDVRVRKALNKAIDREAMNKAFLRGKGETIYNEYFYPNRPGWNPAWERNFKDAYGYDPEAARKLLAEAGYGPNRPMSTTVQIRPYPYFPAANDMNEAVANYWRAVGVNVRLETGDPATFTARGRALEYDNHAFVVITSIRQLLGVGIYNSINQLNRGGVQLPELEEVFSQIKVTLDQRKYNDLWRKWGDMAYERYVNVPLFWIPSEAVVDGNIVADYPFPSSIGGTYTHVEYIKGAR